MPGANPVARGRRLAYRPDMRTRPSAGRSRGPAADPGPRLSTARRGLHAAAVGWAVLAPVAVLVGAGYAASVQPPGYDPVRQTFSALANHGATDRWVMGATLLVLGLAYVVVAAGLPGLGRRARVVLGAGGAAVALVALFPQPAVGSSPWHMVTAALGWVAFTCFPLAASRRSGPRLLRRGPAWAVTAVLLALLAWFTWELLTGGPFLGLAQRVLVVAQTLWPLVLALGPARVVTTGSGVDGRWWGTRRLTMRRPGNSRG